MFFKIKIMIFLVLIIFSINETQAEWKITDSLYHPEYSSFRFNDIRTNNGKDILILVNINLAFPYIYKSNDSGYTWQLKSQFDEFVFSYELEFPNRNLAIFTCDTGYYFRSTNNGETWVKHRFENQRRTWHIGFWDQYKGLVYQSRLGEKQVIQKSTDGGLTWYQITGPKPVHESGVSYLVTKGKGIAYCIEVDNKVDSVYYFHKSTDYGETWQEPYRGPKIPPFGNFYFYNENLGFCFGGDQFDVGQDRKNIRRTDDGGKTWTTVMDTVFAPNIRINVMHFADSLNGIATSIRNVYRTSDSGVTWYIDTTFKSSVFGTGIDNVVLLNANNAVGLAIPPFEYIYRYTSDGTTSVKPYKNISAFDVFPNPAISHLDFNLPEEFDGEVEFSVYTIDGKEMLSGTTATCKIDIISLKSGSYYLIVSKGERLFYSRFVKQ